MAQPLLKLLGDRRLRAGALPWFLALMLLANVGLSRWKHALEEAREKNLLVNQLADAREKETPRFDWSIGENIDKFWKDIPDARRHRLAIVSGMSQTYSINDAKPSDRAIPELLDDALAPKGVRVFGLAAPNLHNEEALLYLVATTAAPETHPESFIYGVCFDKFRNVDIRPGLQGLLRRPNVAEAWRGVCKDLGSRFPLACEKMRASLASVEETGKAGEPQASSAGGYAKVEQRIREQAGRLFPVVDTRRSVNAQFQAWAYEFRNLAFGIRSTSKRPVISSRYELNKQLLELLIAVAKRERVRPFFYVIPLNPQGDNPYVPAEYAAFKQWVEALAAREQVPFANFENVVPADDWGLLNGEPDFKHFKVEGHRATADAIVKRFGAELVAPLEKRP